MYDSMKRHEVHVLKKAGLTLETIARTTGMSRRTVARIARQTPEPAESPPRIAVERPVGRPSCADPYAGLVRKTLEGSSGFCVLVSRPVLNQRLAIPSLSGNRTATA